MPDSDPIARTRSHSGASFEAGQAATSRLALSGGDGGHIGAMPGARDIGIRIPAASTAHIQEVHLPVIHCLCDLVDQHLASQETHVHEDD